MYSNTWNKHLTGVCIIAGTPENWKPSVFQQ